MAAAVSRFAFAGTAALTLLAFGAGSMLRSETTRAAVKDATERTETLATRVLRERLTEGLLAGDRDEIAQLDQIVRLGIVQADVVRVKIWTAEGRIAYSDEPHLIGRRFRLPRAERQALKRGRSIAEVNRLGRAENQFEGDRHLLEVYLPLKTPSGKSVLFETYVRFSSVVTDGHRLWRSLVIPLVASLILLQLIQVPLAYRLANELRRRQLEREGLLQHAIESSRAERLRIAQHLHDGAVQRLAATSLALSAAADQIAVDGSPSVASILDGVAAQTRECVRELRTTLVDLHPPHLHASGLAPALDDLAAPLRMKGIDVSIEVPQTIECGPDIEALLFRTAQETLRNVDVHAEAASVFLQIEHADGNIVLRVNDDGCGFESDSIERKHNAGHVGISLLRAMAADASARLDIDTSLGQGTTVVLEVPIP